MKGPQRCFLQEDKGSVLFMARAWDHSYAENDLYPQRKTREKSFLALAFHFVLKKNNQSSEI